MKRRWYSKHEGLHFRNKTSRRLVANWVGYISIVFDKKTDKEVYDMIVKVLNRELPNGKPRSRHSQKLKVLA